MPTPADSVRVTSLDVAVVTPLSSRTDGRARNEAQAIALAESWVGPNQTQVTITAHTDGGTGTFALRHFTWEDGGVSDSGWRVWADERLLDGSDLPWAVLAPGPTRSDLLAARVDAGLEAAFPSTPLNRMAGTINRLAELLPRNHECERIFADFDALGEYVRRLEEAQLGQPAVGVDGPGGAGA